jgi:uncharacterized surface protein with fasciclin (FAS1) repeats
MVRKTSPVRYYRTKNFVFDVVFFVVFLDDILVENNSPKSGSIIVGSSYGTQRALASQSFSRLSQSLLSAEHEHEHKNRIMHLRNLLLYHVYLGDYPLNLTDATNLRVLPMANGEEADFLVENKLIFVNTAFNIAYTKPSDGYAYMTDQVLLPSYIFNTIVNVLSSTPPSASSSSSSSSSSSYSTNTLATLLVMAGFDNALANTEAELTVFAPTDEAFAALDPTVLAFLQSPEGLESLQSTLRYHVVGGVFSTESDAFAPTATPTTNDNLLYSLLGEPLLVVRDESDNLSVNGTTGEKATYLCETLLLLFSSTLWNESSNKKHVSHSFLRSTANRCTCIPLSHHICISGVAVSNPNVLANNGIIRKCLLISMEMCTIPQCVGFRTHSSHIYFYVLFCCCRHCTTSLDLAAEYNGTHGSTSSHCTCTSTNGSTSNNNNYNGSIQSRK